MRSLAFTAIALCCAVKICTAQEDNFDVDDALDKISDEISNGIFSARIEATKKSISGKVKPFTETFVEYHDGSNGAHSMQRLSTGDQLFYYANLNPKQFVRIKLDGSKCNTLLPSDAAADENNFLYKDSDNPLTDQYFLGITAVLKDFSDMDFKISMGINTIVRGINAVQYDLQNAKTNVTEYQISFATDDWTFNILSTKKVPFPLRVSELNTDNDIEYIYDYYEMKHFTSKEIFQLGTNLQLPFRSPTCQLFPSIKEPALPRQLSFLSEWKSGFENTKLWLDLDNKVSRIDGAGPNRVIQDDNHGLIYEISDSCSVKANLDEDFGTATYSVATLAVTAYNTMPNKYYIGEGTVRGINVDIWEAPPTDMFAAARFYFTKVNLSVSINNQLETQVPVRVLLKEQSGDDTKLIEDVQIFNFYASSSPNEWRKNFNIDGCQGESTFVEIDFESDKEFNVEEMTTSNAVEELTSQTFAAIVATTRVSPLQVPYIRLDVQDNRRIIATAKLLASPAYISSFSALPNKYPKYSQTPINSVTSEGCAQSCINTDSCKAMVYCPADKLCYQMNDSDDKKWPDPSKTSGNVCNGYVKAQKVNKDAYQPLKDITDTLNTKVTSGSSDFRFSAESDEGVFKFYAMKFNARVSEFDDQSSLGPYKQEFTKKSIVRDDKASTVIGTPIATVGECYRQCTKDNDIPCSAFSICLKTQSCVLTSVNVNNGTDGAMNENKVLRDDTDDCSVYSVNYLDQFEKLDGKVRLAGASAQETGVNSAGECAFLCRQHRYENILACRGFDFCVERNMCSFYGTHYTNDGNHSLANSTGGCDHYALRYSADYIPQAKELINGVPSTKLNGVTMDECAKSCSEESDGTCKSIAYCDGGQLADEIQTCYEYTVTAEKATSFTPNTHCTLYMSTKIANEVFNPDRQREVVKKKSLIAGMSNGAFAGLLVAMTFIGIALGASGYRYREQVSTLAGRTFAKRGGPSIQAETTISYNRQDDDDNNA